MDILDRITELLGDREQQELTKYLNLKPVAYSDWKSGKSKSYRKYLIEIAEFFNVSIDYLVYGKEKSSSSQELSDDEQELLTYYKELSDIDKGIIIGEARVLSGALEKKSLEEHKKTIYMDLYELPVSAGTGVYLDSCDKDVIEVPDDELTAEADYALRISGNSMDPDLHDGEIILIHSQPTVQIGEIGIFVLNGAGYVKKLGRGRLISVNSDYEDITFSDNDAIWCLGKVIGGIDNERCGFKTC